jgi:hypothetical protein
MSATSAWDNWCIICSGVLNEFRVIRVGDHSISLDLFSK